MELARAIGHAAVALARAAEGPEEGVGILRPVLLASAAFEDDSQWSAWLEEQLTAIAYALPRGDTTKAFVDQLQALKTVIPVRYCIHGRAEAAALAAT